MPAWLGAGVVGTWWWQLSVGDRVAEHAAVADRFAHEIGGIRIMKASVPGGGEVEVGILRP
jgi:hypothetical protein